MDLDQWAEATGHRPRAVRINEFMDQHPEAAEAIIANRRGPAPYPLPVLVEWLTETYGFPLSDSSLRNWVRQNV